MCRVLAVANQKGGVSKTTTAEHLGIGLVNKGFKVFLIDGDAQGTLTSSLGWKNPDDINYTLASVMDRLMASEDIDAGQGILHHEEGVDLLPGNIDLSVTEANLISVMCRESILRSYVSMVRDRYDYIIIDCTPSFGKLTINALTSADSVIVPITAAYLPTRGLQQLLRTISMVKKRTNKDLYIEGILIAMASNGTAAIVCFPGIIYRGGAEMKIRKYLIDNNYVDCVIQLPSNLFFGTSIATCIMVLKKGKPDSRVLFIDATNECIKVTNNNKLTQSNMDKIVDTFASRKEIRHFSHLAG
jgi:chromosome partitioning protein